MVLHTALSRDPPDVVLAGLTNGMALALAIYGMQQCMQHAMQLEYVHIITTRCAAACSSMQ